MTERKPAKSALKRKPKQPDQIINLNREPEPAPWEEVLTRADILNFNPTPAKDKTPDKDLKSIN